MHININDLNASEGALFKDKECNHAHVEKTGKLSDEVKDVLRCCIDNEPYLCNIRASVPYKIARDAAKFVVENHIQYRHLTLRDLFLLDTFINAEVSLDSYVDKLSRRQMNLIEPEVRHLAKPVGDYDLYSLDDLELNDKGEGWFRMTIIDDDKQSINTKSYLEKTVDEPLFKTIEVSCRRMNL